MSQTKKKTGDGDQGQKERELLKPDDVFPEGWVASAEQPGSVHNLEIHRTTESDKVTTRKIERGADRASEDHENEEE